MTIQIKQYVYGSKRSPLCHWPGEPSLRSKEQPGLPVYQDKSILLDSIRNISQIRIAEESEYELSSRLEPGDRFVDSVSHLGNIPGCHLPYLVVLDAFPDPFIRI